MLDAQGVGTAPAAVQGRAAGDLPMQQGCRGPLTVAGTPRMSSSRPRSLATYRPAPAPARPRNSGNEEPCEGAGFEPAAHPPIAVNPGRPRAGLRGLHAAAIIATRLQASAKAPQPRWGGRLGCGVVYAGGGSPLSSAPPPKRKCARRWRRPWRADELRLQTWLQERS